MLGVALRDAFEPLHAGSRATPQRAHQCSREGSRPTSSNDPQVNADLHEPAGMQVGTLAVVTAVELHSFFSVVGVR